ncbi:SDR family oxidoreductase [Candidatus Aerophobetes bacterium]|uniref:SDR family oxidoreductase n=1 Tax=Aerophobetes bacterium TaxID=2030807 RepID=A0A523USY0_UNCAE|nr:MAG: SDR family oxidoreductase [Candidatus Aerophobetes bacterium]
MMLPDKIAIVTGASKGIGRAIALRLAKEGANVVIADVDKDEGEKVAQMIREMGRDCLAVKCDVSNVQEVEGMVEKTMQKLGRIDILVNNAGVSSMAAMVELEEKDWDFNMDINAKGQFLCSRAVAKHMIKQKSGKIINNASLAAKRGARFLAHYSASKFAVLGLTYTMAIELAPYNITVNAVCPGIVETDMIRREWKWEGDIRGMTPDEVRNEVLGEILLGRLCQPEDVAGAVAFLASKDADYLTGQSINVNGGMESH